MKAVFLDADTLGNDVDLSPIEAVTGEMVKHPRTSPEQVQERIRGFDTVLVNKVVLSREHFEACPELKTVAVVATGLNNIDKDAAKDHSVTVMNVTNYGRSTVAQHTMALILALATRLVDYDKDVRAGRWGQSSMFCLMDHPIMELEGRTLGVVGYGDLGQGVVERAKAFGMNIVLGARPGQATGEVDGYPRIPLDELLPKVDVLSLHCLLTDDTRNMIGARELKMMKKEALLINTSRGGLVDEQALADALRAGTIGGAGFDVLTEEPPRNGNALLADDIPNLIVTPHSAWASREARQRIVDITARNLSSLV
ncbi:MULTISPECIES: D-2-hydroxyacid dehydrogenase [Marinobacter]|jgi:glycerate dehydrogenase|uniref:D-2-hydroxyacid dehydrogenase n=1 Tax=Marinobacter TaxID=2742 RepID=UPI00056C9E31|nr:MULTISPECIES: D-2-hydroxyacid dehydrogenase [Marinobacter]AZR41938.1 glycerate dehydrogenase [Marinobacter salarius]MAB53915.1 glycerate dehydrogenase [Marinobacter sp.]MBJ7301220.1 D-2-hydroxyacid dehydrogenase [Marinobacter salarius]MDM8180876.1 D-2-hydroxyacid dehydrogenase [Marinobacter salarius]RUT75695.1 D-2-hydroxyacid dehydrogenase [Marinobacter sp. NP-6]|tara:strand:+ start:1535 stop:2470 length:936 start_codon:yes stop_codon:yes gene_type:complete